MREMKFQNRSTMNKISIQFQKFVTIFTIFSDYCVGAVHLQKLFKKQFLKANKTAYKYMQNYMIKTGYLVQNPQVT